MSNLVEKVAKAMCHADGEPESDWTNYDEMALAGIAVALKDQITSLLNSYQIDDTAYAALEQYASENGVSLDE